MHYIYYCMNTIIPLIYELIYIIIIYIYVCVWYFHTNPHMAQSGPKIEMESKTLTPWYYNGWDSWMFLPKRKKKSCRFSLISKDGSKKLPKIRKNGSLIQWFIEKMVVSGFGAFPPSIFRPSRGCGQRQA